MKNLVLFVLGLTFLELHAQDSLSQEEKDFNLLIAAYKGNADSIIYWLNNGANANATTDEGICALNYAIQSESLLAVKALVLNGADVNHFNRFCLPPLFMAVAYNQYNMVAFLLDKNANIYQTIDRKKSILHYAIEFASFDIVSLLIQRGANIYARDADLNTPLHYAIFFKRRDLFPLLVNQKSASLSDKNGITPLLYALQLGDTLLAKDLIAFTPDSGLYSKDNYGPYEHAFISGNHEMLQWTLNQFPKLKKNHFLVKLAYTNENRKMARTFRKYGFKSYIWPVFSYIQPGLSITFSNKDAMTGFNLQFYESHYGFNVALLYKTRLWWNRILIKEGENTYFQFWERRSMSGIFISKKIIWYRTNKVRIGNEIGFIPYWTYGRYRGVETRPQSYGFCSPYISLFLKTQKFTYLLALERYQFNNLDAETYHICLGLYLNLPVNKVYLAKKKI